MFVNLTPHTINVCSPSGEQILALPPSGEVARVTSASVPEAEVEGVTLNRVVYGQVEGLPAPQPGVWLVVSGLVRMAAPDRKDLCSPGELVRGPNGQPIGCRGLVVN